MHPDATAFHHLPGAYLGGLAALRLAVHAHQAIGNHVLALAAALRNARELEQIAQPDVLAVQLKLDGFHDSLLLSECRRARDPIYVRIRHQFSK